MKAEGVIWLILPALWNPKYQYMIFLYFISLFRNVLVKGGDLPASSDAIDVLFDGIIHIPSAVESQCFTYLIILLVLHLIELYDLTF